MTEVGTANLLPVIRPKPEIYHPEADLTAPGKAYGPPLSEASTGANSGVIFSATTLQEMTNLQGMQPPLFQTS